MSDTPDKNDRPLPSGQALDLGAWREQPVAQPFDDPKVRRRIAELIIEAAAKTEER
jgi:hypothetical protein